MKNVKILICDYHVLFDSYLLGRRSIFEYTGQIDEGFILSEEGFEIEKDKLNLLNNKIKNLPVNCWVDIDGDVYQKGRVCYDGPYYYLTDGYKDEDDKLYVGACDAKVN